MLTENTLVISTIVQQLIHSYINEVKKRNSCVNVMINNDYPSAIFEKST